MGRPTEAGRVLQLGLRPNLAQFSLLVAVNALVGGMLGQERTVLPLLADTAFGLTAYTAALTFILAFGATKAATNYLAGTLSDRYGRKPVLVDRLADRAARPAAAHLGTQLGVGGGRERAARHQPGPDLVHHRHHEDRPGRARPPWPGHGPQRGRGLPGRGRHRAGHRLPRRPLRAAARPRSTSASPTPPSASDCPPSLVRETRGHARLESRTHTSRADGRHDHLHAELTNRQVFTQTSFREPALSAASQAGMVNNLNDGLAWGLFPVLFAAAGLSVAQIGVLAALYPAVWGLGQLVTGALSDRTGRKPLITAGMLLQGVALGLVAATHSFPLWALAAVLLGAGTAMVYPTLLAAIGDVAHPAWRARAVGVYRLWRDGGFAIGALLAGLLADAFGIPTAIWAVAALTAASGLLVAVRMYETHPRGTP